MNANDQQFIARLSAECDALKKSNAELREQLAANTKLISELQHRVRLVQETRSQQVHEYARKAAMELFNVSILAKGYSRKDYENSPDELLANGVLCCWLDYCRDKGLL